MIIGITGHQDLSNFDNSWIRVSTQNFIENSKITKGLSSLAIGADQLFVEQLIIAGKNYDVIIPCKEYQNTFTNVSDLQMYNHLLKGASSTKILNFKEPSEDAFYAAGIKVVEMADLIIAIWNGEEAKGHGGTGDIVQECLIKGKLVYHINPIRRSCNYLKK